jgi:hypothetical protein
MSLNNKSNCMIITFNNKEYKKIEDVPINEYSLIHTVKDIHPDYFNYPLFNKIKEWTNLRFVSFDDKNYNNNIFISEIANFQYLSTILLIDYAYRNFKHMDNQTYIYKNKMILLFPFIQDFNNIPLQIEHLNIIDDGKINYTNIPQHIKYLHMSLHNKKFEQTNLPFNLETFTITIPIYYQTIVNTEEIKNNIKIPFNCKLIIEFV